MGWWAEAAGTIGDGPADRFAAAIGAFPGVSPADVMASFVAALRRNPSNFLADPVAAAGVPRLFFADGSSREAGAPDAGLVEAAFDAVEAATLDYLDSPLARRPLAAELWATLAFVLRPRVAGLDRIAGETPVTGGDCRVVLPDTAGFARVEDAVVAAELVRDGDAVTRAVGSSGAPDFASWSAAGGREVDYHDADGARWLAVRGPGAAALAQSLAAALGGAEAGDPVAALAAVVTVRSRDAALGAMGRLRWQSLRAAVAAAVPENAVAVTALLMAGLADPDWRVRMTAVIAVGRLRLAGLAVGALAAPVPAAGRDGLGQEDRRMLLALARAAHDRAAGLVPGGESPDPAVAERRRALQAALHAALERLPARATNRAEALLLGLIGGRAAIGAKVPGQWAAWLD